jgi:hypothetical protein
MLDECEACREKSNRIKMKTDKEGFIHSYCEKCCNKLKSVD